MRVAPGGGTAVQDHEALAEIELCGELIIAASAAGEERLSLESIDQVLRVGEERAGGEPRPGAGATAGSGPGTARRC
ncbi:hypothetical protein [Streptomyces rishiriensis]|uniref:Uncharacterized protein n=1 Tax=Streptomyces rishiriensis TaxID=68264 RepID=A0ABU0NRZ6_STRRH|nr:hypothetical protein [Streptomyces rishiriensis]MDQ0581931.1 hypothetical protein [Streptomyces rishiriensis]